MTSGDPMRSDQGVRVLLVWWPEWSVVAVRRTLGIADNVQLALVDRGVVVACSEAAREEGVTAGLRVRQAQHRCPNMTVLPHDPALEQHVFEPLLRAVEEKVPGVHLVRPGAAAVRAQGPSRFYGGDRAAAHTMLTHLQALDSYDVRVAVADGLFAAQQAALTTTSSAPATLLRPGGSAAFLARLPISALESEVDDQRMLKVLRRMGIRTLGDLAALPESQVNARFGAAGRRAHRLASGGEAPALNPRPIPPDLTTRTAFESGLDQVEHILAACTPGVDALMQRFTSMSLLCHEIRIVIHDDFDGVDRQVWRHPWHFTASEVVDRLRWQLERVGERRAEHHLAHRRVTAVEIAPESVDAAAHHAPGLWGDRPDEHVVQTFTTLQHQLGHQNVLVSAVSGGRLLDERRVLRPWGEALPDPAERRLGQPWPGTLPGPPPATVFAQAHPVAVLDHAASPVLVSARGEVSAPPAELAMGALRHQITAWAGPWPVRQRWWRTGHTDQFDRFQLVDEHAQAWLLLCDGRQWWAEARYD